MGILEERLRRLAAASCGLAGAVLAATTVLLLVFVAQAGAGEPPNGNDPCSTAGRDTCGTTGVGFYKTYRYGIRWFGDYKGILEGGARGFCVDLGYWYPSPEYRYTLEASGTLRNSLGHTVPLVNRQKIAYATWAFGRSTNPDRQAAVMLYVHSLMGDARPGEVDPEAIGGKVASIFRTVEADAARYHGPYHVVGGFSGPLKAGESAGATIRVLSVTGAALPGITLHLHADGASGVPSTVTADAQGVARITFIPGASSGVTIAVSAPNQAASVPEVYAPTTAPAAPNAQRLIRPVSQEVTGTLEKHVTKTRIAVSTTAAPTQAVAGHVVRDQAVITGATTGWRATVVVTIHGPFASAAEISCNKKAWQGTFTASGPGTYVTPNAAVTETGWYVFQLKVPGDSANIGLETPCNDVAERFFVQAQPTLATTVSSDSVKPSTPIFDRVEVGGLAGTAVTVTVDLFGPFANRSSISCTGPPVWTGAVTATANGTYKTASFTPTVPGVYAYRAQIESTQLVQGTQGTCGDETETTSVQATPKVITHVSAAVTKPGSQISDQVVVTGAGALTLTVQLELFGPFATTGAIGCAGTPLWSGTLTAKGDGTYESTPVTLERAGYYTYRETIPDTPESPGYAGKCGETSETAFAASKPTVTTQVSTDVVRPGSSLSDQIVVSGLGQTEAAIQVQLFGPFATMSAISCSGKPYSQTVITAHGDGTLHSPPVKVASAGFYTFHETLVGRDNVAQVETKCAQAVETSLGAPAITTGRGDHTRLVAVDAARATAPTHVRIASLGIDAPVAATGIDVKQGVLAVASDIHRTAWWADGAAPGDPHGSIVIAGHVDSAKAGAGAFFSLKDARPGTIIELTTADGKTRRYRVTSVKSVLKADLPTSIWSQKGSSHLVLVTCGGPFDAAAGHYRDNIVVNAVPA